MVFPLKKIFIPLTIILSLSFQLALGAPQPKFNPLTPQQKVAIDPGRVKKRVKKQIKKPKDLTIPEETVKKSIEKEPKIPKEADAIKFKLNKIIIEDNTVYKQDELSKYYKPYLNKRISLSNLQDIANKITKRYRKDGYVLSRAIIPPQKIIGGVVTVLAMEGYISEVYVEGEAKKVKSQIEKYAEKIKKMRPLQSKALERYALLLNDISGLSVKTILSPSTDIIGASDLTFVIEQEKILGDIYTDNRGSRYMGPQQTIGSISFNDAITAADELSFQTVFTPYNSELRYIQASYDYPIGTSGLRAIIDGAFTETRPGFTLDELDVVGRSKSWGIDLVYPLIRSRTKNLWLYSKFDWLDTQTKIFSSTLFQDNTRSIRFGFSYDFIDPLKGANLIDIEFSKGLTIFGASPLEPKHKPLSRQGGLSDYKKVNFDVSRYQSIGQYWMLIASMTGQYSFHNQLLSSEEFSFGGQDFGRAYDPSEIVGDSGLSGKMELRFNTFPDLKYLQQIQYYTFYDIGAIWNVGSDFSQPDKDSASNLGGGLRATLNGYFYGNMELAKPLTREVVTQKEMGLSGKAWRFYIGLGANL